jgi:hypothetical protein
MSSEPMVRSAQTVHLSCVEFNTYLQMERNEFPHGPHHVGVPSVAPKMISEPMICSVQTEHLYCTEINTISKRTKTSFHLIYRQIGAPMGVPKVMSKSMVTQHKPCTYLASRLILSPNGPKQPSTRPLSPRSTFEFS